VNPPNLGVVADDGAVAVGPASLGLLRNRVVAATCCFGDQLGAHAAATQFSLFGYSGPLRVPLRSPWIGDMEASALAAPEILANGGSVQQASDASRRAYSALAQILYRRKGAGDGFMALFMSMNASAAAHWQ